MARREELSGMTGAALILIADQLRVKVACNKQRTSLKEAKAKVIERILEAEAPTEVEETEVEEQVEEPTSNVVPIRSNRRKRTVKAAEEAPSEAPNSTTEETSEETKENVKPKHKKPNLKLTELTYNGETKSIRAWAEEINMPWPTLYDRVNRNGWTVEDAIEIPLGQRRPR